MIKAKYLFRAILVLLVLTPSFSVGAQGLSSSTSTGSVDLIGGAVIGNPAPPVCMGENALQWTGSSWLCKAFIPRGSTSGTAGATGATGATGAAAGCWAWKGTIKVWVARC